MSQSSQPQATQAHTKRRQRRLLALLLLALPFCSLSCVWSWVLFNAPHFEILPVRLVSTLRANYAVDPRTSIPALRTSFWIDLIRDEIANPTEALAAQVTLQSHLLTPVPTVTPAPGVTSEVAQLVTATITASPTQTATLPPTETTSASPTPTDTSTPTATFTATNPFTLTASATSTVTASRTGTFTATASSTTSLTITPTNTTTSTATKTLTLTRTASPTASIKVPSATSRPSRTPLPAPSATVAVSTSTSAPTRTSTPRPVATNTSPVIATVTPFPTNTPVVSFTQLASATVAPSFTATATYTRTPTATANFTAMATATATMTFTPSLTHTLTATTTATLAATRTVTFTPSPTHTLTATTTATPTFTTTATSTATATATFTPSPTHTLTATATVTFTPTFTATATSTPTPTVTYTRTPTVTATNTVSRTPTASNTPGCTAPLAVNNNLPDGYIQWIVPLDGALDVSLATATINLQYSQPMTYGGATGSVDDTGYYDVKRDVDDQHVAILTASYDPASYLVTLTMNITDSDWTPQSWYRITVDKNIRNNCGTKQADDIVTYFRTGSLTVTSTSTPTLKPTGSLTPTATPSCSAPLAVDGLFPDGFVLNVSPSDGQQNVPVSLNTLLVTFTQPMKSGAGAGSVDILSQFALKRVSDNNDVNLTAIVYSSATTSVSITLDTSDNDWDVQTWYYLRISNAIRNVCGQLQGANVYIYFKTEIVAGANNLVVSLSSTVPPTALTSPTFTPSPTPALPTQSRRTDFIGAFQQSVFYLHHTTIGADSIISTITFGAPTDYPLVGDWNGDGLDTPAVYRPGTSQFFMTDSPRDPATVDHSFVFGIEGDQPMAGDWDGDGKDSVGVYRPSTGLFYLTNSLTTGVAEYVMLFGLPGDIAVTGDWDGDGKDSLGVYRPSTQGFYLTDQLCTCVATVDHVIHFGALGDVPIVGDWDGDGHTDLGVYRRANRTFYLSTSLTGGIVARAFVFNSPLAYPLAGHWLTTTSTGAAAPTFQPTAYAMGN